MAPELVADKTSVAGGSAVEKVIPIFPGLHVLETTTTDSGVSCPL